MCSPAGESGGLTAGMRDVRPQVRPRRGGQNRLSFPVSQGSARVTRREMALGQQCCKGQDGHSLWPQNTSVTVILRDSEPVTPYSRNGLFPGEAHKTGLSPPLGEDSPPPPGGPSQRSQQLHCPSSQPSHARCSGPGLVTTHTHEDSRLLEQTLSCVHHRKVSLIKALISVLSNSDRKHIFVNFHLDNGLCLPIHLCNTCRL